MDASNRPPRVLFVCLGNICRSPLAEGIFRRDAERAGIEVVVDSAGTGSWHTGEPPDKRASEVGRRRGCVMDTRARKVRSSDFEQFDLIVAMDHDNLRGLSRMEGYEPAKVRLARSFDPTAETDEVPDPYYGGADGFDLMADMLERASEGILKVLTSPTRRANVADKDTRKT